LQKIYKTVSGSAVVETEEKKSRFIANVKPVLSESEAVEFINGLKKKYWDASHNVYAYYICSDTNIQKFSDDGEPAGTAGLPVLEAIKKAGVQDVAVVVTRYFGGTLLGAGGLVRAYSKCAALGIEAAGIITKCLCVKTRVIVEYSSLGKIQNAIEAGNYYVADTVFGQDVELTVYVPDEKFNQFVQMVYDITGAASVVEKEESVYASLPAGSYPQAY
jgi:uncharacterized YigZ family protein